MHGVIKDNLETYLRGGSGASKLPAEFGAHLRECEQCRYELHVMQEQSDLLRQLRPVRQMEPSAGFYGRLLDRIDSQRSSSIWSIFLEPAFGRRVMAASLATVAVIGAMLALTETQTAYAPSQSHAPEAVMAVSDHPDGLGQDQQRDRETILVDLATYRE